MTDEQIQRLTEALRRLRDICADGDKHTFGDYRKAMTEADNILKEATDEKD